MLHRRLPFCARILTLVTAFAVAATGLAPPGHATAKGREEARRQLDLMMTSPAEVRRLCVALEGPDPQTLAGGHASPLADYARQALRAERIDDALMLVSPLLDDQRAGFADDVARYIDTGEVTPRLRRTADKYKAKAVALAADKAPVATDAATRVLSMLHRAGIDHRDLLDVLRRGPAALDTSDVIVRVALRLAQATHERVDQFASSVPWGLGGLVGWVTETILGELMAVGVVFFVQRVERAGSLAHSTEVARRACKLIETDETRPVLVTRLLNQLVVRLSARPSPSPSLEYCKDHPRQCARLARRWGLRAGDDARITKRDFDRGAYFDLRSSMETDTATDAKSLIERLDEHRDWFDRALSICGGSSSCSFAQVNYALSIVMFDQIVHIDPTIPLGTPPRECVECCGEAPPPGGPIVLPLVVCRAVEPASTGRVAVVLDRSGSTLARLSGGTQQQRHEAIAEATIRVTEELATDGVEVDVWAFPAGTGRCDGPTAPNVERGKLGEYLKSAPRRVYTPMRAALDGLVEYYDETLPLGVVVVTDGRFNCPARDPKPWVNDDTAVADAAARLREEGAAIRTVLVEDAIELRTRRQKTRRRKHEDAVGKTLGVIGEVHGATEIEEMVEEIRASAKTTRCTIEVGAEAIDHVTIAGTRAASTSWSQAGTKVVLLGDACDGLLAGDGGTKVEVCSRR